MPTLIAVAASESELEEVSESLSVPSQLDVGPGIGRPSSLT